MKYFINIINDSVPIKTIWHFWISEYSAWIRQHNNFFDVVAPTLVLHELYLFWAAYQWLQTFTFVHNFSILRAKFLTCSSMYGFSFSSLHKHCLITSYVEVISLPYSNQHVYSFYFYLSILSIKTFWNYKLAKFVSSSTLMKTKCRMLLNAIFLLLMKSLFFSK